MCRFVVYFEHLAMNIEKLPHDVVLIRDFLSPEECRKHIDFSERFGYHEATVQTGAGPRLITGVRNNTRVTIDDTALAVTLFEKLKPFVPARMALYDVWGLNERFRYYRYRPGEQFRRHQDGQFHRNSRECSFITFMVYLNADFEGGETSFPGVKVKPETGMAVIFPHEVDHAGEPVVSGVKYALRTDVMYQLRK